MVRSHVHSRSLFQLVYHSCNFSFKVSGFALKLMMPPLKSKQQISYPSQRCSTKKMFLKISQNSQKIPVLKSLFEKSCRLCWSFFLIKLQVWGLQFCKKGDFGTEIFMWILQKFKKTVIHRAPAVAASFFFFLSGFSFTSIHDSQDSRGKGKVSI